MALSRRSILRTAAGGALGVGAALALGSLGGGLFADADDPEPSVLVAGSLQGVASRVGDAAVEAHGSLAARRLVVEGARDPDALALADPLLFDGLSEAVTLFATNALTVAYDPDSRFADELRADWTAAVDHPRIALGRTDPALDPLGYRTVMALRLAEPMGVDAEAVLDAASVFPETALMRTLEAGEIDAAFTYRNMAVEHDLPRIDLPPEIDFSDPSLAERYATVSVDVGDRTVRGAPIAYAAAALTDRGRQWVEAFTTAHDVLREAGFGVPAGYPRRRPLSEIEAEWG